MTSDLRCGRQLRMSQPRRCVRVREGGDVLQTIDLDQGAYSCMLGGDEQPTLFITAADWPGMSAASTTTAWNGRLIAVPVATPGAGWPSSERIAG
jgi:sugar lactone lactonase YvrE